MTDFTKYQASGNDYVVIDPRDSALAVSPATVRLICDRHLGVGADGVLHGPQGPLLPGGPAELVMYNSDGSLCGRSGNGLRMFALHLARREGGPYAAGEEFTVRTAAGDTPVRVTDLAAGRVRVGMGAPSFEAADVPLVGASGKALRLPLAVADGDIEVTCLNNGNPHTVVPLPGADPRTAHRLGPRIAHHERFPEATNVEFLTVLGPGEIAIEIWERAAGYTLSSGAGACAAASAAHALGLTGDRVTVRMPGGSVEITIAADGAVTMEGEAEPVASGTFAPAFTARLAAPQPGAA